MMAISGGIGAYCFGLPLTVRSSFYPIIGKYAWGWIGDVIDGYSIVMTVGEFAVCPIAMRYFGLLSMLCSMLTDRKNT